jgi:hypothetical protein
MENGFGINSFLNYIRKHMNGAKHTKCTKKPVLEREGV